MVKGRKDKKFCFKCAFMSVFLFCKIIDNFTSWTIIQISGSQQVDSSPKVGRGFILKGPQVKSQVFQVCVKLYFEVHRISDTKLLF